MITSTPQEEGEKGEREREKGEREVEEGRQETMPCGSGGISQSVGYGGGREKEGGEREIEKEIEVEELSSADQTVEVGDGGSGEVVEVEEKPEKPVEERTGVDEDSDATVGGSPMACEEKKEEGGGGETMEEQSNSGRVRTTEENSGEGEGEGVEVMDGVVTNRGSGVVEGGGTATDDPSSSSWRLVYNSASSDAKPSSEPQQSHTLPLLTADSQLLAEYSIPDSEPPLVIDVSESQCSSTSTANGLTAVAALAESMDCDEGVKSQTGLKNSRIERGFPLAEVGYNKNSSMLASPFKSQQAREEELACKEEEEEEEGGMTDDGSSHGFSLRLSQSQTTPTTHTTKSEVSPGAVGGRVEESMCPEASMRRPVPVYESMAIEELAPFEATSLPLSHHLPTSHSSQTPSLEQTAPSSACSETLGTNEVSQASSSSAGTPFQFQLPQNGLLIPHPHTSPPPPSHSTSSHPPTSQPTLPPPSHPPPSHPPTSQRITTSSTKLTSQQDSVKFTTELQESHTASNRAVSSTVPATAKSQPVAKTVEDTRRNQTSQNDLDLNHNNREGSNEGAPSQLASPHRNDGERSKEERSEGGKGGCTPGGMGGRVPSTGFVLGARNEDEEEERVVESDSPPIAITVAGDSQFETSADSQQLLNMDIPTTTSSSDRPPTPAPWGPNFRPQAPLRPNNSSQTPQRSNARRPEHFISAVHVDGGCRRDDPFEFDSQSHNGPAKRFICRRRKRADDGTGGATRQEGGGPVRESGREEETEEDRIDAGVSGECPRSVPPVTTHATPSSSSHPHPSTSSPAPLPPSIVTAGPFTPRTSTHPSSTSTTDTPLPLLSSPHLLHFTSPSSRVSREDLSAAGSVRLRAGTGGGGGHRYAVRHVKTYRQVVEVRVVSQEVFEGDSPVEGLSTVWQVYTYTYIYSSPPFGRYI